MKMTKSQLRSMIQEAVTQGDPEVLHGQITRKLVDLRNMMLDLPIYDETRSQVIKAGNEVNEIQKLVNLLFQSALK